MAVNLPPLAELLAVRGVELSASAAGIRYRGRDDLVLLRLAEGTQVSGVFTRNAFCAAPVIVAREHLASATPIRAILINAGNANAGTGAQGLEAARQTCELVAEHADLLPQAVLPLSTGVIGEALPLQPFRQALPALVQALDESGWGRACRAIMTTDTQPKAVSRQLVINGETVTVTGMAKGAGMIRPDMATMLALVATDARLEAGLLDELLAQAVAQSFNAITVDGDTSTNDACLLIATGQAPMAPLQRGSAELQRLAGVLNEVCRELAQACVRDAEGATRFITVTVEGASSVAEAREVAYSVAHSPLVKTAAFAGDPNWGRILAAVGRSRIEALDLSVLDLFLDEVCLIRSGEPDPQYQEAHGAAVAQRSEFEIRIRLGRGAAAVQIWTCDFSYDYVKINAEYRS